MYASKDAIKCNKKYYLWFSKYVKPVSAPVLMI